MGENYNRGYNGSSPDPYSSNYQKDSEWYRGHYDRIDHDAAMAKLWSGSSSSGFGGSGSAWSSSSQSALYSPSVSSTWSSPSSSSSTWSGSGSSDSGAGLLGLITIGFLIAFWKVILMVICALLALAACAAAAAAVWSSLKWFVKAGIIAQWVTTCCVLAGWTALSLLVLGPWFINSWGNTLTCCAAAGWMWMPIAMLLVPLRRSRPGWAARLFETSCGVTLFPWGLVAFREVFPELLRSHFATTESFFTVLWVWVGALFAGGLTTQLAPMVRRHLFTGCSALPVLIWIEISMRNVYWRVSQNGFSTPSLAAAGLWMGLGCLLLSIPLSRLAPKSVRLVGILVYSQVPFILIACLTRNFPEWIASLQPVDVGVWILGVEIVGWLVLFALTVISVVMLTWFIDMPSRRAAFAGTWMVRTFALVMGAFLVWQFFPSWIAAPHEPVTWIAGLLGWSLWLAALWCFGNITNWALTEGFEVSGIGSRSTRRSTNIRGRWPARVKEA